MQVISLENAPKKQRQVSEELRQGMAERQERKHSQRPCCGFKNRAQFCWRVSDSPKRSQLTLSHQRARKLWHLPTSSPHGQRHAPEHGPRTMGREHLRQREAGSRWPGWHLPAGNFQDRETVIEIQSPSVRVAPSSLHP